MALAPLLVLCALLSPAACHAPAMIKLAKPVGAAAERAAASRLDAPRHMFVRRDAPTVRNVRRAAEVQKENGTTNASAPASTPKPAPPAPSASNASAPAKGPELPPMVSTDGPTPAPLSSEALAPAPAPDAGGGPYTHVDWMRTFTYQGGPVITKPLVVQNIFYGDWSAPDDSCAPPLIEKLVNSASDASSDISSYNVSSVRQWWQTATLYTQNNSGTIENVTSEISVGGTWMLPVDPDMDGVMNDLFLHLLIKRAARLNNVSLSDSVLYNFFLGPGIVYQDLHGNNQSSFCGFHSAGTDPTLPPPGLFLYAVYMHPRGMPSCTSQPSIFLDNRYNYGVLPWNPNSGGPVTANGCLTADTLADTVMHEIVESATDPLPFQATAWMCSLAGENCENADICSLDGLIKQRPAWLTVGESPWEMSDAVGAEAVAFAGAQQDPQTGAWYNVKGIDGTRFYIAPNVDPNSKKCVMAS